ncbi:hypothetical protein C8R47DRAFT_1205875 [Mycena vitilis]|nr:hypothetical protein C8R47DRAFT_1205875 [Mycena vitilis]
MATTTEHAGPSPHGDNPDNTGGADTGPRSSTPPPSRTSHQRPNPADETLNPEDNFELVPLEDLTGPLHKDDISTFAPILTVDMDLPALRSVAKIGNHPEIKARRNDALVKGLKEIEKNHLLSAGLATRRLFKTVFPAELDLLECLFSHAQSRERLDGGGNGYRLVIDDYQVLLRVLYSRKTRAEDAFRMAGKRPPPIPSGGADDDLEDYFSLNDFEILAICFRAEVENFLYTLDRFYDFVDGQPWDASHEVMQLADQFEPRPRRGSASPAVENIRPPVKVEPSEPPEEQRRKPFVRDTSGQNQKRQIRCEEWDLSHHKGAEIHLRICLETVLATEGVVTRQEDTLSFPVNKHLIHRMMIPVTATTTVIVIAVGILIYQVVEDDLEIIVVTLLIQLTPLWDATHTAM